MSERALERVGARLGAPILATLDGSRLVKKGSGYGVPSLVVRLLVAAGRLHEPVEAASFPRLLLATMAATAAEAAESGGAVAGTEQCTHSKGEREKRAEIEILCLPVCEARKGRRTVAAATGREREERDPSESALGKRHSTRQRTDKKSGLSARRQLNVEALAANAERSVASAFTRARAWRQAVAASGWRVSAPHPADGTRRAWKQVLGVIASAYTQAAVATLALDRRGTILSCVRWGQQSGRRR